MQVIFSLLGAVAVGAMALTFFNKKNNDKPVVQNAGYKKKTKRSNRRSKKNKKTKKKY